MMATPLLTAQNLHVGYVVNGMQRAVLTDVRVSLKSHSLVCFMGPNGIGKSTLLRTLAGLQKPLAGNVRHTFRTEIGKEVAVVLTDRINAYRMTVYDLVSLGRYPHVAWHTQLSMHDEQVISESLSQVKMLEMQNKLVNELSDGQLQMVMIARALAQQTPVLILDEPTAHLDLNNRVEIMKLLRDLSRTTGKGILIATHELDLALQMADEIWLATSEKSIFTGIPEDLVLDESFDRVFQFKGFDLKTGKVTHEPYRNKKVRLVGEGYRLLWTKNALERMGYEVTEDPDCLTVRVQSFDWIIDGMARYESLSKLLDGLTKITQQNPNVN